MSKSEKNFSRKSLRSKNQRLILETIKKNERISRAELSQTLNISAPSISENVDLLLKRGLIYEAGVGHSSGGRKPVVLSYNYDYRYLLAVSLSGTGMKISLSNLALDLLRIKNIERDFTSLTLNDFLERLLLEIEAMLKTCDMKDDQLAAIVLSMPGIISENEIICSRKFPHLKGYKLYERLSEFFKAKVMIKNDVNAKTLGIHKELPTDAEKIVFISPEPSGVGSGIMLNGSLYEGSCQGAGEIGRMLFQTCDLSSKTSEPQFLENIVSKENIKQFMLEKSEKTEDIKELVNEKGSVDFSKVTVAYEKGNPLAQMTMEMIAKHYALAIHNISVILNPDLVILGGDLIEMGDVILKEINLYLEGVDCLPLKIEFVYGDKDIQLLGTLCFGESYTTKNILTV